MATHPAPGFTRDDYRRLAVRIRRQREARGWKQRELSQRSGISADRLSRLERGAPVRVDELYAFSFAFGLRSLLTGNDSEPLSAEELDELKRLESDLRGLQARWLRLAERLGRPRRGSPRAVARDRLRCVVHDRLESALRDLASITRDIRECSNPQERRPDADRAGGPSR